MRLEERDICLSQLQQRLQQVRYGEGHCILISGEAGIGKSSLVKAFSDDNRDTCTILQGLCDALFTPRPLAPLYDIARQLRVDLEMQGAESRSRIFTAFLEGLINIKGCSLLVFEDIHWADEATIDFIKFLARRITRTKCLFILTYRDDEVHAHHPVTSVAGQLAAGTFSRLQLQPLSKATVEKLAMEKGYKGEDVFGITGGNPFYVNEVLAGYSPGLPGNVKDSIIAVYNRQPAATQKVWDLLSVAPSGFEIHYLDLLEPGFEKAIETSVETKIVLITGGRMHFKHELYRRAVEAHLSPLVQITLNKKILHKLLQYFTADDQTERVLHHAIQAGDNRLVVEYGPVTARKAAAAGAHIQACKLYLTIIANYSGDDAGKLRTFYAAYAYECYLTNNIKEAIVYQEKVLNILLKQQEIVQAGDSMRFLSRLCWYDGNRKKADAWAKKAIEALVDQPASTAKAMALSNMAQLKMLADELDPCLFWGEQAIAMAEELGNKEILSHALNNVGTALFVNESRHEEGKQFLQQSLAIAVQNNYHEHAARAYTNLGSNGLRSRRFAFTAAVLDEGIAYCEERDLDSWSTYMLQCKAKLCLETGRWDEAADIAGRLIKMHPLATIVKIGAYAVLAVIQLRKENGATVPGDLLTAKTLAFEAMELQRIMPVMVALLEFEWITGKTVIDDESLEITIKMIRQGGLIFEVSEFAFWLFKARKRQLPVAIHPGYNVSTPEAVLQAAGIWDTLGCPYQQALILFEAGEESKLQALAIMQWLGADVVYKKLQQDMRSAGIKSIPRGKRKSTRANPAMLTEREVEIVTLVKNGLQDKEIAATLFISTKTVGHHISSILFKLDVNSRVKAVQQAVKLNIIA